jgi:hypothetical protein
MREDEALFTCFKFGWKISLVPRNAAGRWATLVSLIPVALATAGLVWIMASHPDKSTSVAAIVLYVLLIAGWSIGFIIWGKANSVVVDLSKLSRKEAYNIMRGGNPPP